MTPSSEDVDVSVPVPGAGGSRRVVGIGEFAISRGGTDVIVTHALGSCVAVCLWDPVAEVAGLLHVLLPDSRISPQRAAEQPAAFADTGMPLLFRAAYALGAEKRRLRVSLVGGGESPCGERGETQPFSIGRRNVLAIKNVLWRNGVLVSAEDVGGTAVRTVYLAGADGRIVVAVGDRRVMLRGRRP
ncbi:MAG TPA: chemotaxis protein CheD [Vicinamibacterales bacterium]